MEFLIALLVVGGIIGIIFWVLFWCGKNFLVLPVRSAIKRITHISQEKRMIRQKVEATLEMLDGPHAVERLVAIPEQDEPQITHEIAAAALGEIGDMRAVDSLIQALGKEYSSTINHRAATALKQIGRPASASLVKALEEHDAQIRTYVVKILDDIGWKPQNEQEHLHYLLAKQDWQTISSLGTEVMAPLWQLLTHQYSGLQESITIALEHAYAVMENICFGKCHSEKLNPKTTLWNPDVSELTYPMKNLRNLIIWTATYDFHQVERFLTYAVNYVGQKYLKEQVEVHIYGDPAQLQSNLRNSLTNLCKSVTVH